MAGLNQNIYTSAEQELILKASLLKGRRALGAWEEWKGSIDLEDVMDNGSFRLLPLLYKNLLAHNVSDPFMDRLKGVYRQTWYKNQKLFYDTSKFLRLLHGAGIDTMIVKGAALSMLSYKDTGARPMADVDIMVRVSQIKSATDILKEHGWKPDNYPESAETLRYRVSLLYINKEGDEFDLHWIPYNEFNRSLIKDLWNRSVPVLLGREKTKAPSMADSLVHVIMHGTWWNPEPPIRWIADAMSILSGIDEDIDWDWFVFIVEKSKISLRILKALDYLIKTFDAKIPDEVIELISSAPVSMTEKIVHRYCMIDPSLITRRFGYIPILYLDFMRVNNQRLILWNTVRFPKYLQYIYRMDKLSNVFYFISAGFFRKMRKLAQTAVMKVVS